MAAPSTSPAASPWRKAAIMLAAGCIIAAMSACLVRHGGPMLRAAAMLAPESVLAALVLCLVHRLMNAGGWGIVLRALGEPVAAVPAARVWLASEACRWLPGSLWSFGSRAMLATRLGVPATTTAASLALELGVTVLATAAVAAAGAGSLPASAALQYSTAVPGPGVWLTAAVATLAAAALVGGAAVLSGKGGRIRGALAGLAGRRVDGRLLAAAGVFYLAMVTFNGAILHVIVSGLPARGECPLPGVVSANAIAWLVGFFAIFAPGGLVVREAVLAGFLSAWMPGEQAIAVALAWRLVQIVSEIVAFVGIAATGLPQSLSGTAVPAAIGGHP